MDARLGVKRPVSGQSELITTNNRLKSGWKRTGERMEDRGRRAEDGVSLWKCGLTIASIRGRLSHGGIPGEGGFVSGEPFERKEAFFGQRRTQWNRMVHFFGCAGELITMKNKGTSSVALVRKVARRGGLSGTPRHRIPAGQIRAVANPPRSGSATAVWYPRNNARRPVSVRTGVRRPRLSSARSGGGRPSCPRATGRCCGKEIQHCPA